MEFKHISSVEGKSIVFSLASSESTQGKYPFDFELVVSYLLKESILEVQYEVRNSGSSDMFFSL